MNDKAFYLYTALIAEWYLFSFPDFISVSGMAGFGNGPFVLSFPFAKGGFTHHARNNVIIVTKAKHEALWWDILWYQYNVTNVNIH